MSYEIKGRDLTPNATFYALIYRNTDNQIRRTDTGAFEAYAGANYANYPYATAAANAQGDYLQNPPSAPALPAGSYDIKIKQRIGGAAAESDPTVVYAYTLTSDGAGGYTIGAGGDVATLEAAVVAMQADVDALLVDMASALAVLPDAAPGAQGGLPVLDAGGGVTASVVSDKSNYALSAAGVKAIWDQAAAALTTVGSIGKVLNDAVPAVQTKVALLSLSGTGEVNLNMTQAVPTNNTGQTVGDALNAARAAGFGKAIQNGTVLTLYAADGTTVVRTFTLDNATAPTSRS